MESAACLVVLACQTPGATQAREPRKPSGCIKRGLCALRAATAGPSSVMGAVSGCWWHHCSPASASASVALLAGERSQPEKKLGGGGKRDVSGTTASLECVSAWPG